MQDHTLRAAKSAYLKALVEAIRQNYGCTTLHTTSNVIRLRADNRTVKIQVETFQLINCTASNRCFAWFHPPDPVQRHVVVATVLASPDIVTAEDAVRLYLTEADREAA
jgi:hypothetical protein